MRCLLGTTQRLSPALVLLESHIHGLMLGLIGAMLQTMWGSDPQYNNDRQSLFLWPLPYDGGLGGPAPSSIVLVLLWGLRVLPLHKTTIILQLAPTMVAGGSSSALPAPV